MKKIRSVSCLIALLLLVLPAQIGMGQNIADIPEASPGYRMGGETPDGGYVVHLEVDGGFLTLTMPKDYQYQPEELSDIERYPFSYTFANAKTGASFIVYSDLDNLKNQKHFLRKLYDESNSFVVVDEDYPIGEHAYLVYTSEWSTYQYGFLVRAEEGYSYQFHHSFPYDDVQHEMPAEAVSILSTLEIHEDSGLID